MAKTGPKGPRNKVKQVVLVNGHPNCIFEEIQVSSCSLKFPAGTIKMGNIGQGVAERLKEALKGSVVELKEENKAKRRAIKLPGVLSVKTTPTNTLLTVGAESEESLNKRVNNIHEYLSKYDVDIQERCHWICTIDKKDNSGDNEQCKAQTEPKAEICSKICNICTQTVCSDPVYLHKTGYLSLSNKHIPVPQSSDSSASESPIKEKGPARPMKEKTRKLQAMAIRMGVQ